MDEEQEAEPSTKNRNVIAWLRLNLGVTVAVFSIVSGVAGALISGTLRVASTDYQLADIARINNDQQKQLDQLHADMVSVDQRLNSGVSHTDDVRRIEDAEIATLQERIAVLEAQLRFLADRTPTPQIGSSRK